MPKIHYLKCWGEFFVDMMNEEKSFDYRRDDRGFSVGDCVVLEGYEPVAQEYDGTPVRLVYQIRYILRNNDAIGLRKGYCILQFEPWPGPLPVPAKEKENDTKGRTKKKSAKKK